VNFDKIENFRAFYEKVGDSYPEEDLVYRSLRGLLRKKFVLHYVEKSAGRFLDVGCNRGTYLKASSAFFKVGVDISFPALRIAKKQVDAMRLAQGDCQNLSFLKPGSFDFVLCSEVIEHVTAPEEVIKGCFNLLKPGGRLLITTPNYRNTKPTWVSIGEMAKYGLQGVKGERYYHTAFRPEELKALAEDAGFSAIQVGTLEKEVKYATRLPVLIFYIFYFLNKFTIRVNRLESLNRKGLDFWSLRVYRLCSALGLNDFFCSFVKEGVRTFMVAEK